MIGVLERHDYFMRFGRQLRGSAAVKPILKGVLRGAVKGPGQAVAIALVGAAARHFVNSKNRHGTKTGPIVEAEDWMFSVKEDAKKWLRDNRAPERLKEFAETLISSPSRSIVDVKAKPDVKTTAEDGHWTRFLRR